MLSRLNMVGIITTTLNLVASALFSYFLTSSLTNNTDALNLVANVFSILSGFLLLVITMSGENSLTTDNLSEMDIANQEVRFTMRFNKYYSLFLLYIATLALIFIYYLLGKSTFNSIFVDICLKSTIGYIISFLTCFSFIQSTFIPIKIKALFKEKRDLKK
ncbi:hypothetical protein D3C77_316950 [compost metagenome]